MNPLSFHRRRTDRMERGWYLGVCAHKPSARSAPRQIAQSAQDADAVSPYCLCGSRVYGLGQLGELIWIYSHSYLFLSVSLSSLYHFLYLSTTFSAYSKSFPCLLDYFPFSNSINDTKFIFNIFKVNEKCPLI